jgi:transposase-like protein
VARELDISANTLHGWIKQYKQKTGYEVQIDPSHPADERTLRELRKQIRDLRGERNFKKGDALLREGPEVKYSFIHKHRFKFRVENRKERLAKRIKQIFLESRRLYGSPKIGAFCFVGRRSC